jgi:hypothetical protein
MPSISIPFQELVYTLNGIKQHEIYSHDFCDNNSLSD